MLKHVKVTQTKTACLDKKKKKKKLRMENPLYPLHRENDFFESQMIIAR